MNVFDLNAKIGLNTSEYTKGLSSAEKSTKNFSQKLGAGIKAASQLAVAAIGAISVAAIGLGKKLISEVNTMTQYGDTVDKMSQKMGLSAEAYQKWDYVLKVSGSEMSNMTIGLKTLTNQIDEAKNGSDGAQKKFAALGITMEQLQGMSREEVFEAAISGFQRMADSTERAALANDLFGRSGQELTPLFNTTIEETKELIEEAEKSGSIMSDEMVKASAAYQDTLTKLQATIRGIKLSIFGDFIPSFTKVVDGLSKIFGGEGSGIAVVSEGLSEIANKIVIAGTKIVEKGGEIIKQLGNVIINNAPALLSAVVTLLNDVIVYMSSKLPDLIHIILDFVKQIAGVLLDNLPLIFNTAMQMILELANGIGAALPELIPAVVNVILTIVKQIISPETIGMLVDAVITVFEGLANGIIEAMPLILDALPVIVENIIKIIVQNIPKIIKAVVRIILTIIEYLLKPDTIGQLLSAVVQILVALVKGIVEFIPEIIGAIGEVIWSILTTLGGAAGDLFNKGKEILQSVFEGIGAKIGEAFEWGKDLIRNFVDGIKAGWNWLKDGVVSIGEGIKDFLGFSEPKKGPLSDFHTYAPDMMKLYAQGIKDNAYLVENQLNKSLDFDMPTATGGRSAYAGATAENRNLTLIMEIDKQKFAKAVVDLGTLEQQRQGKVLFSV